MAPHGDSSKDTGRSLKRRKTRKGTRSCWACKRRKVKCTYASPTDDVCIGCTRRCLDCVSQEFPDLDPGPSSNSRLVGDRIGRLESMIKQLAEQVGGHIASTSPPSTPASIDIPVPPPRTRPKYKTLSQALLAAYPSPHNLRIIGSTGENLAIYLLRAFTVPSRLLEKGVALESEKLWGTQTRQQYTAETHPVIIARQMLLLAIILQHLHAAESARSGSSRYQQLSSLSRPPRVLAKQLADAATTLVTAHDRLTTDTIEGLECLWLETVYHEHNGSLRQSWLACRRAISAAHLMGFQGRQCAPIVPKSILERNSEAVNLQQIWFRLVHNELALCLALEMPLSAYCLDDAFIFEADVATTWDDIVGINKLERRYAAMASRFLEWSKRDVDFEDLEIAHQIRTEMEEAANAMPSGWWRTPSLVDQTRDETEDGNALFGKVTKFRAQILHFHLLLLADLPSMLQATCGEPTTTTTTTTTNEDHPHHVHNRNFNRNHLLGSSHNICVEASRDLLRRFIHLRSCERTVGYFRLLDHYSWLAAVTLLLARLLDGCQTMTATAQGSLDHQQHLSDRAMASEAMERMWLAGDDEEDDGEEETSYYLGAAAKGGTEDVLPQLLALEARGAAVVVTYRKPSEGSLGRSSGVHVEDRDTLVLRIPFVGLVSIVPKIQRQSSVRGLLSKTKDGLPIVLDDEAEPQASDSDDDSEEEEDDDEASLKRAIKLRRSAQWSMVHYMLRPG